MKNVIVGTAGHIDHGKSALVLALTGTDPDRLKEEKARGITIDLGFANYRQENLNVAFVDVPGHERFVRNMLAGASGIDCVLLVVAADESVMPQTREHFDICRLLGVQSGCIALTKSDLVDEETLELVQMETRELVQGSFLDGAPMVAVSARSGRRAGRPSSGTGGHRQWPRPVGDDRDREVAGRPHIHREGIRHGRHGYARVGRGRRRHGARCAAGRPSCESARPAGSRRSDRPGSIGPAGGGERGRSRCQRPLPRGCVGPTRWAGEYSTSRCDADPLAEDAAAQAWRPGPLPLRDQ